MKERGGGEVEGEGVHKETGTEKKTSVGMGGFKGRVDGWKGKKERGGLVGLVANGKVREGLRAEVG